MEKYCHDLFFISANLAKLCKSLFDFTEDLCLMFQHLECCWTLRVFSLYEKGGTEGTSVRAVNDIFTQPAFLHVPDPAEFHWVVLPSLQVPSWAGQKHRSASTTTPTGRRTRPTAAGSSPATVTRIRGDTALPPGRIFLDQLKSWSKAAGWMTSIVMTGEFS